MHDHTVNVAAVEGYEVTITITPPTGPYLIDRTIDLSCFINPTPPDPVIYRWRILSGIYSSWEPTNQNISFSPNAYDNFHYIWFYCQVFSNAVQIAEGEKAIEVYGKLVL